MHKQHATAEPRTATKRLAFALFALGLPGVLVMNLMVTPGLLIMLQVRARNVMFDSAGLFQLVAVAVVQGVFLLVLAVAAGQRWAGSAGLRAPTISARLDGHPALGILLKQARLALPAGLAAGAWLILWTHFAPAELVRAQAQFAIPLAAKLLYGGITEEILVRWGMLAMLIVGLRKAFGLSPEADGNTAQWAAIALSAVLFGVSHLPVAAALLQVLDPATAAYIVAGNAVFGVLAGVLCWRHGLEAAIVAHSTAHLTFWLFAA